MVYDPLSRLCVVRLTQHLELNCLEELQHLEECSYVAKNVEIEEQELNHLNGLYSHSLSKQKSSKNQVKRLFKNISKRETPHVFGQTVSETTLIMIIQLIDHLKENATVEGLFRISGNKKRQEELKVILNKNEKLNLNAEDCPYNVHDIAGILKYFFSELPEPLLTKSCFVCYQQLAGNLKEMDSLTRHKRKIDTLNMLFLLLPPLNRLLLKKLIRMLAVVAENKTNKMTAFNLGVIFAPNIVCTRQPMGCLSDFTENVEPFTDLVKFIIENADTVFEVPVDFIEEGRQYLKQVALDEDNDVEVPLTRTFCQQLDVKQYTKEGKENTNQELMLLYSQMADMPDGPIKREFLEKFKQSYPGTPMFIPKSVKERRKSAGLSSCPSTPGTKSKLGGCLASCSVKKAASENFLDVMTTNPETPASKKLSSRFGTPGRSEDNILAACSSSSKKPPNTPSTPSRMKNMCKIIRRRSVDLFKPKDPKRTDYQSKENIPDITSNGLCNRSNSRIKGFFRSYRKPVANSWRGLKKSVSTPTLTSRRKGSCSSDELDDDEQLGKRKLYYSTELVSNVDEPVKSKMKMATSFDEGFLNDAFIDAIVDEQQVMKVQTPVIRKTLYPAGGVNGIGRNDTSTQKQEPLIKSIENTPKILKPKYKVTGYQEKVLSKPKGVKVLGGINKFPLLSSRKNKTPFMESNNKGLNDVTSALSSCSITPSLTEKTSSKVKLQNKQHDKENVPIIHS